MTFLFHFICYTENIMKFNDCLSIANITASPYIALNIFVLFAENSALLRFTRNRS